MTTPYRQTVPPEAETLALIEATHEEAVSFLTSCVHFARFCEDQVDCGTAIDVLKAMTAETYARLSYYEGRLDPISGKLEPKASVPPTARTQGGRFTGGFRL